MDKKLKRSIATIIGLCLSLVITSLVLAASIAGINNNSFATGIVKINLNDEKPVFNFTGAEPGMTLEERFWLRNESTISVYYKIYFSSVRGKLADILEANLYEVELDKNGKEISRKTIFTGTVKNLKKKQVPMADAALEINETQYFVMRLHFPEDAGNELMKESLSFDIEATAVQTKNNPNREY